MVSRAGFLTTMVMVLLLAFPVHAPKAAPASLDAPMQTELVDAGEIIVTARRGSESVQDVPIAISVISGDRPDTAGSYNVSRLVVIEPSLTIYSTTPRNSAANIRGLGTPSG